jgi:hypothetical protein
LNGVILAELEFFHSRRIAPTRRVALGDSDLPVDPAPGFGGILLGGVVAANARDIDPDLRPEFTKLIEQLDEGRRIPQPRLRHRFQKDRIGLLRSRQRLIGVDGELHFEFDEDRSSAEQRVLAAVYAAGQFEPVIRHPVMLAIRRGMRWAGPVGPSLMAHLSGSGTGHVLPAMAFEDPFRWALDTLGFDSTPTRAVNGNGNDNGAQARRSDVGDREVQRRFRDLVRAAHPDHGGESEGAAQRIADLREARRILLAR